MLQELIFRIFIGCFIALFLFTSCQKEDAALGPDVPEPYFVIPEGFPNPDFPKDNAFSDARWVLGKKLFYDPILSRTGEISCASCHLASFAFSDTVSFSPGVNNLPGTRNAPTLANVAYHPYFTREGGVPSLEMQVLVPIQEHNEFDFNIIEIADKLKANSDYVAMAMEAYDRTPDHYVITRALATFERSFISGNSLYDQYFFQDNKSVLNEKQKMGMELFFSEKTNCSACHDGFNFTNYSFENNGLYNTYEDSGRFRLTKADEDIARFKVPSLRNIEKTSPYMHDGSINTLAEVIVHYNSGGKNHSNKSALVKPMNLSKEEQEALVAFLISLTDADFINNKKFRE